MSIRYRTLPAAWLGRLTEKVRNWRVPLVRSGEAAADAIVETTLKGIGENDAPFVPYSPSYTHFLERTKAKPTEPVNLRGALYSGGRTNRGGNRIRSQKSRAGIYDAESEMSRDLIKVVVVEDSRVRIVYKERKKPYMKYHLDGSGNLPQRKWFSIKKSEVKAAAMAEIRAEWHDRIAQQNGNR